ncbi:MAG: lipid IV(A) 3-deoxy-D-manno-octulosonic acid transferase, partial [Pseudomonadales bacterium]
MKIITSLKTAIALAGYLLLVTLLLPLLPLRLLWRSRRAPAYRRRMLERFGFSLPAPRAGGIWMHAVSVGETFAAESTVRALLARYPNRPITITTTTPTGSAQVQRLFGERVEHCYAPYDWPLCVWLFLRRIRPDLLVVMETELWPLTLLLCRALGIDVLLANARLSEKSARGYRKVRWLIAPAIADIAIAAQHEDDAGRLLGLGAEAGRVKVTGSVKFDVEVDRQQHARALAIREAFADAGQQPVWIAASTHAGEEKAVLDAQQRVLQKYPQALLVLVPRHPERFVEVAGQIAAAGFSIQKRSAADSPASCASAGCNVLLVDTLGELMLFYGSAEIAFVGGSLVPVGGHNYLEPASWRLPVLSGPHTHNFSNIARQLQQAGALQIVEDGQHLGDAVLDLLSDKTQREMAGDAAARLLE